MRRVTIVQLVVVGILLGGFHHVRAGEQEPSALTLVRQAAAEGRISYKRTTPEEFKQIAGKPTKERVSEDGEVVEMEYPGVHVKFFGKPQMNTPVTILWVSCDGKHIDIGEDRYQENVKVPLVQPFDDVRSKDLSRADLSSRTDLIATLIFNQQTVWPEPARMPPGSDPKQILAYGMNPGLGVRVLHRQGITGKGVNVAIIDQPLLPDHPEYNGKIVAYHDTGCNGNKSSMHGPAVASLLVGTNCGTAPDARVYYVAAPSWTADAAYEAKALDWIIQQNAKLPASKKIRIVSNSGAPSGSGSPYDKNGQMWDQACARAEANGIMVLDCTSHRGFISRCWYDTKDPESVDKCTPGGPKVGLQVDLTDIHVPSSCRTTAQHYDFHGRNSHIYWGRGGLSWSIPYCAGVLAMGWQIRPDLSPAQMKELLFASAHVRESGAKIIHPAAFITLVRNQSTDQH
ncbi:MAG: hypothetical protein JSW59_06930, partial [Phycisphaerales bacterium]